MDLDSPDVGLRRLESSVSTYFIA